MADGSLRIFKQTGIGFAAIPSDSEPVQFLSITPRLVSAPYADSDDTGTSSSSDMTDTALFAYMPVTGMTIDQGVDASITKTLNDDFLVTAFGDVPVQIVLNGINFFDLENDCIMKNEDINKLRQKQIMAFYERWKLSANIRNRLDISIVPANKGVDSGNTFVCALIKMRASAPIIDKSGSVPAYRYNMTLIGVRQ